MSENTELCLLNQGQRASVGGEELEGMLSGTSGKQPVEQPFIGLGEVKRSPPSDNQGPVEQASRSETRVEGAPSKGNSDYNLPVNLKHTP